MKSFFNIKKGDIVSITGAGGKTSLMFFLANTLKKHGSVLIATTTKIFKPKITENNSFIFIYPEELDSLSPQDNFIHIYCPKIDNNKILSASFEELNKLKNYFDYILIEADGSSSKPLKGWRENEPNVTPITTKTIAVIDITALGKSKTEETIHRLELFQEQYFNKDLIIKENDYINYINSNKFFLDDNSEKILFFNKIESIKEFQSLFNIINGFNFLGKIYFGAVFKKEFNEFKSVTPIVLAAGFSKRFLGDKLKFEINNISILERTLKNISEINFKEKIVVGKNSFHNYLSNHYDFQFVQNNNSKIGQSYSVVLGTSEATSDGYLFIPGDMPFLKKDSLIKIIYKFQYNNKIIVPFINEQKTAPVLFPSNYSDKLLQLKGDNGGKEILKIETFIKCNFKNSNEFFDIDTKNDLEKFKYSEEQI
ncbi:MAG: selenium cofactor biosynthesis protein YqeC [Cetobacterium sp.]